MARNKVKDPNKLGFGRLLAFKSSDIVAAWINLIMLNYLSIYASDTLGVNLLTVSTLLLASKAVDAVTDMVAGVIVDNTHTKLGKGRPYELSIIGMTFCTVLLFAGNPAWSEFAKCAWIFCMYTLTFSIFATMRNAAMNPYTIRTFSNNPVLLKKVSSYGGIITMAGSIVMSTLFPVLMGKLATSAAGWTRLIFILMVPSTVIGLGRFIFCKEDPSVDAESKQEPIRFKELGELLKRNKYVWLYAIIMLCYNIMTNLAVGAYYFKWIVGNISVQGLLSIVSFVLVPIMLVFPVIMKKIGSMGKMIFVFSIVGVVGYGIAFFSGSWLPGVFGGYVLGQLATLPIAYYGVLFIMNICTYNEMQGMPRMDGSSGILSSFAAKLGGALGAWVTGVLLSLAGYISAEGVSEQPTSALMMIRIDFAIVPAILVLIIGICCLAFSKLEKQAAEFEAEKKANEVAAAENA